MSSGAVGAPRPAARAELPALTYRKEVDAEPQRPQKPALWGHPRWLQSLAMAETILRAAFKSRATRHVKRPLLQPHAGRSRPGP